MARPLLLKRPSPFAFPGGNPGFDPNHPASKGLTNGKGISCVAIGGNMVSLLSGKAGTITGSPTEVIKGGIGPATDFPNSSTVQTQFSGQSTAAQVNCTWAGIVQFDANLANFQTIIDTAPTGNLNLMGLMSTGNFGIYCNSANDSGITAVAGVPYFYAVSAIGTAFTFVVVNLRTGKIQTATASGLNSPTTPTATLVIGGSSSAFPLDGALAAVMWAPTALSAQQLLAWAADPWSFWYPRTLDLSMMLAAPSGGGTAHTLSAAEGAFVIGGQAATLNKSLHLTTVEGAFTIGGQAATLNQSRFLAGGEGAFTIGGQAATLAKALHLSTVEGAFTIGGQAATLNHGRTLSAAEGAFVIGGEPATLNQSRFLAGVEGAFTIGGQSATLTDTTSGHSTLSAAEGAFTIGGQSATLNAAHKLGTVEGAFTIGGEPATLNVHHALAGVEGAFSIGGEPATLNVHHALATVEGAFVIGGDPAALNVSRMLSSVEGSFVVSGQSAKFPVALSMRTVEGAFVIGGQAVALSFEPAGGSPAFAAYGPQVASSGGPQAPGGGPESVGSGSPQVPPTEIA